MWVAIERPCPNSHGLPGPEGAGRGLTRGRRLQGHRRIWFQKRLQGSPGPGVSSIHFPQEQGTRRTEVGADVLGGRVTV